jgi:hypothetical protein
MATPIGTILGVGMLGLGAVVLVVATVITAFIELSDDSGMLLVGARPAGMPVRTSERSVTTAI